MNNIKKNLRSETNFTLVNNLNSARSDIASTGSCARCKLAM